MPSEKTLQPVGPLEEDIIRTLARLMWRKQNLSTFHKAAQAIDRFEAIWRKVIDSSVPVLDKRTPEQIRAATQAAEEEARAATQAVEEEAREELGDDAMELVEMGERATIDYFVEELTVVERIDGAIDRCLKRLLMVRGAKSTSLWAPTTAPVAQKRGGHVRAIIEE